MLRVRIAVVAAALLGLAACSSGATPAAESVGAAATAPQESSAPSSSAPVGVTLGPDWASTGMSQGGAGYSMTVDATSSTDLYDARLSYREPDGAVTDVQYISLHVTGPSTVGVRWPTAAETDGTLRVSADGRTVVAIDLGDGCVSSLPPEASASQCLLRPAEQAAPASSAAPSPTPSLEMPTADEAMSYLCSVSVSELPRITSAKSDPYGVAVLQTALAQIGYDVGDVDGRYGPVTKRAVRAYQTDAELTVDGLVGPQTWTSLQTDACAVSEDPAA